MPDKPKTTLALSDLAVRSSLSMSFRVSYRNGEYHAQRRAMGVIGPSQTYRAASLEQAVLAALREPILTESRHPAGEEN